MEQELGTDATALETRIDREGRVSLIPPAELHEGNELSRDGGISEWKVTLQLARILHENDLEHGARLLAAVRDRIDPETIRQLAYWIYITADKKEWTATAALFNALGTSWSDLEPESRKDSYKSAQHPLPTE